jgi:hypothetical protein
MIMITLRQLVPLVNLAAAILWLAGFTAMCFFRRI